MSLIKDMRLKLRPSSQERKMLKAEAEKIQTLLKKTFIPEASIQIGGSLSKDTLLISEDMDIDFYVIYKRKYAKQDIAKKLELVLKKRFSKVKKLHGSRDYFQVNKGQYLFEFVPILRITKPEQAHNITDISPLHSKWVNKTLTAQQKDDVRLLKAFCKSGNVYGAESYINGFSGYVCEILIGAYGSFEQVLKKMSNQENIFLDLKKYYKNKQEAKRELNVAKTKGAIIIIDPVQKERNAASAVSITSFKTFKKKAKYFLKNPSEKFFMKKKKTIAEIKKQQKNKQRIVLEGKFIVNKKDIAGAKAMKAKQYLEAKLKQAGFDIKSDWQCEDTVLIWFDAPKKALSPTEIKQGPPIELKEQVKRFKQKYSNVKEKKKRLYATIPRKYRRIDEAISVYSRDDYVKERLKNVRMV